MPATKPTTRKSKPWWLGAVFVVIGVAILLFLGTWQLQRLSWKQQLLAKIAAAEAAAATPLESVMDRPAEQLDFMRVSVTCRIEMAPIVQLYTVQDGVPGKRVIGVCAAAPRSGRYILVDRGFIADDEGQGPLLLPHAAPDPIVGVLRKPSPPNRFTPPNDPAAGKWYSRDIPAMAKALGASNPMPVTLMLESPAPPDGAPPHPSALPTNISNRHLDYALTWYGLAAALVAVYIAMLLRRRRT